MEKRVINAQKSEHSECSDILRGASHGSAYRFEKLVVNFTIKWQIKCEMYEVERLK